MKKNIGLIISLIFLEPLFLEFGARLPVFTEVMLLTLLWVAIVLTGSKHAYHYASNMFYHPAPIENKRVSRIINRFELHSTQMWFEFALFGLLMLAGVEPLKVIGVQFLARLPFQGLINWSVGKPFVDRHEAKTYTFTRERYLVKVQNLFRRLVNLPLLEYDIKVTVKKFMPGYWSWFKPVIGIILIYISFKLSGTYGEA